MPQAMKESGTPARTLAHVQEVQYRLEAAFSLPGMRVPSMDVFSAAALLAARENSAILALIMPWPARRHITRPLCWIATAHATL